MKILVTGGAGFVGSHLVDELINRGYTVSVIDSLVHGGKKSNLNPNATIYRVDITRHKKVARILSQVKPDAVFHLAAHINARYSIDNPLFDNTTNTVATLNLLEQAHQNGLKKFFFVSTGGISYGDDAPRPTPETHPTSSLTPYCISKMASEQYVRFFAKQHGIQYTIFRPANIYGPRQNGSGEAGVIAIFLEKMLAGINPIIYGDGRQTRDWVYVKDVVNALICSLEAPKDSDVYHIASEQPTSVNQVFLELNAHFGNIFEKRHIEAPWKEQKDSCLSSQKIQKELGWKPEVSISEGLYQTVQWFRATRHKSLPMDIFRESLRERFNIFQQSFRKNT